MCCAFEQSRNSAVASGGLDNVCTVYQVGGDAAGRKAGKELMGHEGYISCIRFNTEKSLLTSSGDGTSCLWDIEKGSQIKKFRGHSADVLCLANHESNPNLFVSSSCDTTVKMWDIRTGQNVQTFVGHELDVNTVCYFPDGNAIASGSDDATCRIFDSRCCGEVNCLGNNKVVTPVTSVQFSKSGRYVFGGYEDGISRVWDVLKSKEPAILNLTGHDRRVSSVCVNPRGDALSTASWDSSVRVWA